MKQRGNNPVGELYLWLRQQSSEEACELLESYRKNYFKFTDKQLEYGYRLMDSQKLSINTQDVLYPGFYLNDETNCLYRVVYENSPRKSCNVSWRFTYSTRWTKKNVDAAHLETLVLSGDAVRLTEEEAIALGMKTGICAICGRTLSDAESVKQGIGPHCRKQIKSIDSIGE